MEANHENPETQNTELVDRDNKHNSAVPELWRGDAQCGWRLYADLTDPVRHRNCRYRAGHEGPHEPANGGAQAPGETWWRGPAIRGKTISELEAAQLLTLCYVGEEAGWSHELHQEANGYRVESTRAGRDGYGSVTRITRARSPHEALTEARQAAADFDRLVRQ